MQGGEIPREYYLKGTVHSGNKETNMAKIHHGATLQLPCEVPKAGHVIR